MPSNAPRHRLRERRSHGLIRGRHRQSLAGHLGQLAPTGNSGARRDSRRRDPRADEAFGSNSIAASDSQGDHRWRDCHAADLEANPQTDSRPTSAAGPTPTPLPVPVVRTYRVLPSKPTISDVPAPDTVVTQANGGILITTGDAAGHPLHLEWTFDPSVFPAGTTVLEVDVPMCGHGNGGFYEVYGPYGYDPVEYEVEQDRVPTGAGTSSAASPIGP